MEPNFLIINIIFRFPSIPLIKHELNCQVLLLEMCSPCWTGQQFPKGIVINLIISSPFVRSIIALPLSYEPRLPSQDLNFKYNYAYERTPHATTA